MEFENKELGVKFTVPERVPVRKQLQYRSLIGAQVDISDTFERFWQGVLILFEDWECEAFPDPDEIDLDKETDPKAARIIQWACNQLAGHMTGLGNVPKNS